MSTIQYPVVNGVRRSFSEVGIIIGGITPQAGVPGAPPTASIAGLPQIPFEGIKSISYHASMKRTKVRGPSPIPIGRTRGVYEVTGKLDVYSEEFQALQAILSAANLGQGWMESAFNLGVTYAPVPGAPLITDVLVGTVIDEDGHDGNAGSSDPLVVSLSLDVMWKGTQLVPGGPIVCDIGGLDGLAAQGLTFGV